MLLYLLFLVLYLGNNVLGALSVPEPLHRRTLIDEDTCSEEYRDTLLDILRRVSAFADDAIAAVSPWDQGNTLERRVSYIETFERAFHRRHTRQFRSFVFRVYRSIRAETYRHLQDTRWEGMQGSQITLGCQIHSEYDSQCESWVTGDEFLATSIWRGDSELLLVGTFSCSCFFCLSDSRTNEHSVRLSGTYGIFLGMRSRSLVLRP